MKSTEIRSRFIEFFVKKGHTHVPSSSLIPAQDPTLLFANAGMNQFKDLFLGKEKRSYTRAVTAQKCVRAGGKHNDLDNVGFTKRHCTFFEMLGNFSFGDYFKKEAIEYAWEFLTKEMHLPVDKLHVSVFENDDEAYAIWRDVIGIPEKKIHRLGAKDNFWQMGETGPCGPCTEIHIDRGPDFGCQEECGPACDCDRFLEIWNLVFMQFDRQPDGTDKPLAKKGVDTGMGLERLCVVVQKKDSVFETDVFEPLLIEIERLTGKKYAEQKGTMKAAFHVLADHIRSSTMLIADGCIPSNEGRGYVLRKIIRRAALFSLKLTDKIIFPELSSTVVAQLGGVYPELKINAAMIRDVLHSEITKFSTNLIRGKGILERYFEENKASKCISGDQAFKLYDTYGFPFELIEVIAKENGFAVDLDGFEAEMRKQQEQSGKSTTDPYAHIIFDTPIKTNFVGYDQLEVTTSVAGLVHDMKPSTKVAAGEQCWIITKETPFFIAGGGQVADQGTLIIKDHEVAIAQLRAIAGATAALITAPVALSVGDAVVARVDKKLRADAMRNHTATHLLQAALMKMFGKQVKQAGSLVHPEYLRFDFTLADAMTNDQAAQVETMVNDAIQANIPLHIEYTTMDVAVKRGALAFFGDKYNPENVRLVEIPGVSAELCGGTHAHATGELGAFKITEVSALSAGHRRITAVTGSAAVKLFQQSFSTVKTLAQDFKVKPEEVVATIAEIKGALKTVQNQIKHLKQQLWVSQVPVWLSRIDMIGSVPFLFASIDGCSHEELKELATLLEAQKPGLYFLVSGTKDAPIFVAMLSSALSQKVPMKDFAAWLKETFAIRGGGSALSLQGGGGTLDKGSEAAIRAWLAKQVK